MRLAVHICGNKSWGGAETRARLSALMSEFPLVICEDSAAIVNRMSAGGIKVMPCRMSGMFASVNLSRLLRHLPEGECVIHIHSHELGELVESALRLSGRKDLLISPDIFEPAFPPVVRECQGPDEVPTMLWIGRITPDCGLLALIDALGRIDPSREWRLRIVGEGNAKIVMPIVNRARSFGISGRIDWVGYVDDVYSKMDGVSFAVITRPQPMATTVGREYIAASVPVVAGVTADDLHKQLIERL